MPRQARVVAVGVPHHVTQRGNNRQDIFLLDDDRRFYLETLGRWSERCGLTLLGYCLMTNHVHLVAVPQRPDSLAQALGNTHQLHAQRFNRLGEKLRSEHSERYQREILLETVLEATPSAVMLFDAADVIVFDNGAARDLFFAGERLVGQSRADLLERAPPELREMLGDTSSEGLVSVERADGAETFHVAQRHLELRFQPHRLLLVKSLSRICR